MLLIALVGLSPPGRLKNQFLRALGLRIHPTAHIGPVLILGCTNVDIGPHTRIGPLNVFRSLRAWTMKSGSEIGQWNWVSAAPFLVAARHTEFSGCFVLGVESAITSRHYFDVSGGIVIGDFVTIAGVRSVFMSHGIDVEDAVLDTEPIFIGSHSMVGGCTNVVLGATIPPRAVIAMGSTVIRGLTEPDSLYAGIPASRKKPIDIGRYGTRLAGPLGPRESEAQ